MQKYVTAVERGTCSVMRELSYLESNKALPRIQPDLNA